MDQFLKLQWQDGYIENCNQVLAMTSSSAKCCKNESSGTSYLVIVHTFRGQEQRIMAVNNLI
ncbi:hypothetical protein V2J09_023812 [Rumex salicifolius]